MCLPLDWIGLISCSQYTNVASCHAIATRFDAIAGCCMTLRVYHDSVRKSVMQTLLVIIKDKHGIDKVKNRKEP
jgi:hypothetical protein